MKKILLLLPLFFTCQLLYAQVHQPKVKQDSLHRADSITRRRADSIRIAQSSPLLKNKNKQVSTIQPMGSNEPEKKIKSDYTYDKDGRIIGGNTNLNLRKKKKN